MMLKKLLKYLPVKITLESLRKMLQRLAVTTKPSTIFLREKPALKLNKLITNQIQTNPAIISIAINHRKFNKLGIQTLIK